MEKSKLSTNNPQIKWITTKKKEHHIYLRPTISEELKKFAVEKEFTISDAVDYILGEYLEIYGDLKRNVRRIKM